MSDPFDMELYVIEVQQGPKDSTAVVYGPFPNSTEQSVFVAEASWKRRPVACRPRSYPPRCPTCDRPLPRRRPWDPPRDPAPKIP